MRPPDSPARPRRQQLALLALLGCWLFALGAVATAHFHSVQLRASAQYWVDRGQNFDVAQVHAQAGKLGFTDYPSRAVNRLAADESLWLRLDLSRGFASEGNWVVALPWPMIDDVKFYQRDTSGDWIVQRAGDLLPRSQWSHPSRVPEFHLRLPPGSSTVYLRARSAMVFPAPLRILSEQDNGALNQVEQLLYGLLFGAFIVVCSLALLQGALFRDHLYIWQAACILALLVCAAAYSGIGGQFVWGNWPQWTDVAPGVAAIIAAGLWLVLVAGILDIYTRFARGRVSLAGLVMSLTAVLSVTYVFGGPGLRVLLLSVAIGASGGISAVLAWRQWRRGAALGRGLFLALVILVCSVASSTAITLGWIDSNGWSQAVLMCGLGLAGLVLTFVLNMRSRYANMATAREQAISRYDALTGLLVGEIFKDRLDQALWQQRQNAQHLTLVGVRLVNLHLIRDAFGEARAEAALLQTSQLLRRLFMGCRTIGRVSGDQFGLVLEYSASEDELRALGSRLVAMGLMLSRDNPLDVEKYFHVIFVRMDSSPPSEGELLAGLQNEFDQMARGTRRAVRVLRGGDWSAGISSNQMPDLDSNVQTGS
jgi:two-component system, sensor histidine kinase LadS